jgi:hypothetical protein
VAGARLLRSHAASEVEAEVDVIDEPDPRDDCTWIDLTFSPAGAGRAHTARDNPRCAVS